MGKRISVLVFVSIFALFAFGCGNKNIVKNDEAQVVEKEKPKVQCPEGTVYLVADTIVENTIIHLCLNEFGREDGQMLAYFADTGNLSASLWFKDGKSVGKWIKWDNKGNLLAIEHYNNVGDVRHGFAIFWEYGDTDVKCTIFAFTDGTVDIVAFEFVNEKFSKILVYTGPDTPQDEVKRSEITKRDAEMLDNFYQEDIVGKELVGLPKP